MVVVRQRIQEIRGGVDNCSLAYRKYLLKIIAATNQGQKYGQLFRPKSIAYDDKDKKYYVVDCYHHSVQCFYFGRRKRSNRVRRKVKICFSRQRI